MARFRAQRNPAHPSDSSHVLRSKDQTGSEHSVDLRAVQRVAREDATRNDSDPWSLVNFDPDDKG